MENWVKMPLRLLYWSFFKPFTLRVYQQQFDLPVGEDGDLPLLAVRHRLGRDAALRRYLGQQLLALLWGLLPLLTVLAEVARGVWQPAVPFSWQAALVSVLFSVLFSMQDGVLVGVLFGVLFSVMSGVQFGVHGDMQLGVMSGVQLGVLVGVLFGVLFGVLVGVLVGVHGDMQLGVMSGVLLGVSFGVLFGVAAVLGGVEDGLPVGLTIAVVFGVTYIPIYLAFYFRLPLYLWQAPLNALLYRLLRNRLGQPSRVYQLCPLSWDELIVLPLPYLDKMLLLWLQRDRPLGLTAVEEAQRSPGQRWAARRANEILVLEQMGRWQTVEDLAAAPDQLSGLPLVGPVAYRRQLGLFAKSLKVALSSSTTLTRKKNLEHGQAILRTMQIALAQAVNGSKKGKQTAQDRLYLQTLLEEQFTLADIQQIGFELQLGAQQLTAEHKSDLSRQLIINLERKKRLPELLPLLEQKRPSFFAGALLQQQLAEKPLYFGHEFKRELDRWAALLTKEIGLLAEAIAQSPEILNPYSPGTPLQPQIAGNLFHGRDDIFREIESCLAVQQLPTLMLHGPRRSGKSSLLHYLPDRMSQEVVPIFVDLQQFAATVQRPEGFVAGLAKEIREQAQQKRSIPLPRFSAQDFANEPYLAFQNWLSECQRPLRDYTLFITFDEFEWINKAIDDGRLEENVLSFFRTLIQRGGPLRLALLFAGLQLMDEMNYNWPSYFINVRTVQVGYLPEEDARNLILQPTGEGILLAYEPTAVDHFLQQTRCQPYLIQLVAFDLINYLNAQRRRQSGFHSAKLADVEVGLEKALNSGMNYFQERWKSCTPAEHLVLADLVAGQPLAPELDENKRILALNRLVRRELIEKTADGRYQIQIPLVARWIQKEKPPSIVRAEYAEQQQQNKQ